MCGPKVDKGCSEIGYIKNRSKTEEKNVSSSHFNDHDFKNPKNGPSEKAGEVKRG